MPYVTIGVAVIAILWLVKLSMVVGGELLTGVVYLANMACGITVFGCTLQWCMSTAAEHHTTEDVLHLARRTILRHIDPT